jgi:molybdate transport system substrate-binding protein
MMIRTAIAALALPFITAAGCATSDAAELKVLCAGSLQRSMTGLMRTFARSTGDKVAISYGSIAAARQRAEPGEAPDVMIASRAQIAELARQGMVVADTEVAIARVGIGAFVRKGVPTPDISSPDAFTKALLGAKSLAFNDPDHDDTAGAYMQRLIERLGLAEAVRPKLTLTRGGSAGIVDALTSGKAELAFYRLVQMDAAIEPGRPLPDLFQGYTLFGAGMAATSPQARASRSLIAFISSEEAAAVFRSEGLQPFY